jgi:hypothetical protein
VVREYRNSIGVAGRVCRASLLALAAVAISAFVAPAFAQDADDAQRGVARISVMDGQVSVKRGDAGDWVAGVINAPLLSDDSIATAPNSRAEVQFDSSNLLRLGANAQVHLTTLENQRFQMELGKGTATFRVLRPSTANVEVDTPSISVRPSRVGVYRISVNDAGETQLTVRAGDVEVYTPKGSQWVNAGQTMLARGSNADPEFQILQSNPPDEWDRWNDQRDQLLTQASAAYQNVPPGVYGVEDMQGQGNWVSTPDYGQVWQPTAVPAGWAPYSCGRWVWADWYGWTWVDCASWGWAPFHYGRWFHRAGYGWLWYPGVIGVRHYWSPGLVAFFGWGGGVGFGFGFGNVGWVPLAPYEVFHPWWGRGFYGAGFASRVSITNINVYNNFRNARVLNGVSGVTADGFRGGHFGTISHLGADQIRTAGVVHGQMPIGPSASNLHFAGAGGGAAFRPANSGASHFFTHQQPAASQHMAATENFRSEAAARASNGSDRFGGAQAGRAAPSGGAGQRFGTNGGAPAGGANTAPWGGRQTPATQNTRPGGAGPSQAPAAGPWQRFGQPGGSNAPHNEGQQPRSFGGSQSGGRANINPPVVHERQGGGGFNNAPRQAPSYNPPPQRQAPSYNPPARQSAPQSAPRSGGGGGGGARPSGGGGGGRPSGGGGGGHSGGGHR